jgi:hypothetical protein
MAVDEAASPATVAGTYSSTHPMEGEGLQRGQVTWSVVQRDGVDSPTVTTPAELEIWAKRMMGDEPPHDRGGLALELELRLDPSGRFDFRGPLRATATWPSMLCGTWQLKDGDVVLTIERGAGGADRFPEGEIVCHYAKGFVYFPWSDPALMGDAEVKLARRV